MSQITRPKICDKKYKLAELKVLKILTKIENFRLSNSYISCLDLPVPVKSKKLNSCFKLERKHYMAFALCVCVGVAYGVCHVYSRFVSKSCIFELPSSSKALFRPPEDCSMCIGVSDVARLANVSAQDFEDKYAYKSVPVIVTDGTEGWRAMKEFNFNFFANFYRDYGRLGRQVNDCFYFAYKSGLNSLTEVFAMDEKRANLSGEPWYVGWSTCYDEETRRLRAYYSRPYFLPKSAESDMVDWLFMGGPGQGAHMHVDSVRHTSWQAQVRGRKQWQLAPPPECLYHCRWITFHVSPGEILVVDTNRWYHKTNVLPGDISITIGAEYD